MRAGRGDDLAAERKRRMAGEAAGGFAPPSSGTKQTTHVNMYLDKQKIGQAVAEHFGDRMNRPPSAGSGFDGRMSFIPSAP